MRPLFWIGLLVCLLGIVSFVVPVPRSEAEGFSVGSVSVDVVTTHSETIPPALSLLIVAVGVAGVIVGWRK